MRSLALVDKSVVSVRPCASGECQLELLSPSQRSIALGATAAGIARPVLQAYGEGGPEGARAFLAHVIETVRSTMLLTGSRTLDELRRAPRVTTGELSRWIDQLGA